jgi:hypothetical protein
MIADLDDHLRSRTTSSDEAAAATATPAGWAEVR